MVDLKLENDERIICRVRDAGISDGKTNDTLEGLFLTNRHLISVYEKPFALFSKEKMIIDKKPLESISLCNGEIQVATVKDDEFEVALHIFYDNGMDYLYSLGEDVPKSKYLQWEDAIKKAVVENRKNIPLKKENDNENAESTFGATITEETNEKNDPSKALNVIFCTKCGAKNNFEAKFCQSCGFPMQVINNPQSVEKTPDVPQKVKKTSDMTQNSEATFSDRKQEFVGKILKCPACGEILKSFVTCCPSCGLELRGEKATSSVREFALKLEAIESHREYEKPKGILSQLNQFQYISKTDEQKISLIKNFPVPNTKEDILEFMILATSNVDMSLYESINQPTAGTKAINEAWNSKIKQVYAKAQNANGNDADFARIQELYDFCSTDIAKRKKKKVVKWVLLVGWIPLLWIIIIVSLLISEPKAEKEEIARLEAIVVEVQDALEAGEYKLALNHADSIDYQRYKVEMERKWDIQREYWVDKVLEEASKNGVELEYTLSPDVDKANDDDNSDNNSGGFVEGFKEGTESGLEDAQENIDEFNRIMNGEEPSSEN